MNAYDSPQSMDGDDEILCFCEWVPRSEIIATIPRVRNVRELRDVTRACVTCFGCEGELDDLVATHGHAFGTALKG